MEVEINLFGVVLAALSTMVVGAIWYAKPVFGNTWASLVKLKDKDMQEGAPKAMGITFVVSLITAYVLAHVTYLSHQFFNNTYLEDALMTAFWVWLGFTAARMITHDVFEQRKPKLTGLNIAHELVTFLVMGLVIGLIGL